MLAATTTSTQLPASSSSSRPRVSTLLYLNHGRGRARGADLRCRRRLLTARGERPSHDEDEEDDDEVAGFDAAVALFNRGEYHACHDVVEELWYAAEDPVRTLLHGLLQCAVGFHHLFNQNHRGAMMELGEGLCKLRKLNLDHDDNPFSLFRDDVSSVLQFLYRTQKELAACTDDMCLTMNGSPTSYQLLGDFAAGRQLYRLKAAADTGGGVSMSIIFSLSDDDRASEPAAPHTVVKLPTLHATEQNLTDLQRAYEFM
ncbi:hypothetical protein HU200_030448 [Digitaria exilis]|uniref:DUF309 domain-containing protein n=1 Tax=Digitaria exilis TaxID=1010633 RepID=A0A835ER55_9POAL|nr:hypothetical protein HU200_030448 [Digitaria exilis]